MTTISKFYFHDAATPNTGTMRSDSPATIAGGVLGTGTEATGASTARDATDVIGAANPDTKSVITAQASTVAQRLGHRRFVSRPLAAFSYTAGVGTWTWSYARFMSNSNHVGTSGTPFHCWVSAWRPSNGTSLGNIVLLDGTSALALTETADSVSRTTNNNFSGGVDGDILVFDVYSEFQQNMSTAYTDDFCYDGTTEASITTCASFVTPPAALALLDPTGAPPLHQSIPFISPGRI